MAVINNLLYIWSYNGVQAKHGAWIKIKLTQRDLTVLAWNTLNTHIGYVQLYTKARLILKLEDNRPISFNGIMVWLVDVGFWDMRPKIDGCPEESSPTLHLLFTHNVVWSSNNNTSLIWMELICKDIVSLKRTQSTCRQAGKSYLKEMHTCRNLCNLRFALDFFVDGALKSNSTDTLNVTEILTWQINI